jgi:exosortase D (VPLPA-CTERM-specific)
MRKHIKNIVTLSVSCAAFLFLYRQVLLRLWNQWATDDNYTHGFFVIPVALFFVWERRHRLRAAARQPSILGLLIVLGSLGLLLIGSLGAELFLTRISLVGTIAGTILFLYGREQLKALLFPLAFLLLMIPIPPLVFNQVAFPLQLLAARFGEAALLAVNIPVLREGNLILLSHTTLEVVEACSGIRSLVSLIMGVIIFAYFRDRRQSVRTLIVLSTVPIAIVANGLRILGTGLAVQNYGPAAAEGFFHAFSGWMIFIVAFLTICLVNRVIVWIAPDLGQVTTTRTPKMGNTVREPMYGRIMILTFTLVSAALYLGYASKTEVVLIREPLTKLPLEIGNWHGRPTEPFSEKIIATLGVDEYLSRVYADSSLRLLDLYVGYHESQRRGGTIHSPQNCLPGAGWIPINWDRMRIPAGVGAIEVNRYVVQKGIDKALVLYWYHGAGRVITGEYEARFYLVLDSIRKNRSDGALVRVVMPITKSEEEAQENAANFVKSLFPLLSRHLPA